MPSLFLALALTIGCKPAPVVRVGGATAAVDIELANPSSCVDCDPFAGVDSLRVEVWRDDARIASDTFPYPGDPPTLPDLRGFGVVRVFVLGLAGGEVRSAGRTRPIAVGPDGAVSTSVAFLPVNTAFPLANPMSAPRSDHAAWTTDAGEVVLLGGADERRGRSFASVEVFDPLTWGFTALEAELPAPVADAAVGLVDGALVLAGGQARDRETSTPSRRVAAYQPTTRAITVFPELATPRHSACLAAFRERSALILGGAESAGGADLLTIDPVEGTAAGSAVDMRDLDPTLVTGCVTLDADVVFVQGADAASTGWWTWEDGGIPGESFTPIREASAGDVRYVRGATLRALDAATVWIAGGQDVRGGGALDEIRIFDFEAGRFVTSGSMAEPRYEAAFVPWAVDPAVAVVGCGYGDPERLDAVSSIELLEPTNPGLSTRVPLDRARAGCSLSSLDDGTILVAGGWEPLGDDGADAAIVVPWVE